MVGVIVLADLKEKYFGLVLLRACSREGYLSSALMMAMLKGLH